MPPIHRNSHHRADRGREAALFGSRRHSIALSLYTLKWRRTVQPLCLEKVDRQIRRQSHCEGTQTKHVTACSMNTEEWRSHTITWAHLHEDLLLTSVSVL